MMSSTPASRIHQSTEKEENPTVQRKKKIQPCRERRKSNHGEKTKRILSGKSIKSDLRVAPDRMAREDEEKWWLCFDKTGRLCRTKNFVSDPECIKIMEPNSGNREWTNWYWTTHIIGSSHEYTVYRSLFFPDFETLEALPSHETVVAIKIFNLKLKFDKQRVQQELRFSTFIGDHPSVIEIKKIFRIHDNIYAVMPYMAGGSLQSIISSCFPNGFPEDCVRIVLRETLKGLSYIHGKGLFHKYVDAKYLFHCPNTETIKLAFAGSLFEQTRNFHGPGQGQGQGHAPVDAMPSTVLPAPEATENYTGKADVWLVGVTAMQLGYGLRATSREGIIALYNNLRANHPMEKQKLSESFMHLIGLCLSINPSSRPSPDQLLRHSFFDNCADGRYFGNTLKARREQCRR